MPVRILARTKAAIHKVSSCIRYQCICADYHQDPKEPIFMAVAYLASLLRISFPSPVCVIPTAILDKVCYAYGVQMVCTL